MRLNIDQIWSLPLEERQKRVDELSRIQPGEKGYKHALEDIAAIKDTPGYTEAVKADYIALKSFGFEDSQQITKGDVVKLYAWQYAALTRFFQPVPQPAAQ